jgi:sugar phosphate isomerase/epimerase
MLKLSRREFVGKATAATGAAMFAGQCAFANPLGVPLGIQLFSVRQQMAKDLDGAGIRAAGFTEVEAASLPKNKSAKEIRLALDQAGLRCVSAHQSLADMRNRSDDTLAYNKELGVSFIICPSPAYRSPVAPSGGPGGERAMTLDDWRYNAEQFNRIGEEMAAAGIRFGYHNHTQDFDPIDGTIPYLELLRLTDAKRLTFEMDCGWAVVAGMSPVKLMQEYPHRFSMLHVKDFTMADSSAAGRKDAKVTELGKGAIDYRPIFRQAAKTQHIEHAFVEQEAFDMPWQDSLKVDVNYMRRL